jgi:cytochrome c5
MAKKLVVLLVVSAAIGLGVRSQWPKYSVNVPEYKRPPKAVLLEQNWTAAQRAAFHHTAQGTRLVPLAWFLALEQPCVSMLPCGALAEPGYLARFGFIPSDENPDRLPVGFARQDNFHDPVTKKSYAVVGLTCAACHTGELFYREYAVRIEGGPAMADLGSFQKALGLALVFTKLIPGRYGRFEQRVLGEKATEAQKAGLKDSVEAFLAQAMKEKKYTDEHGIYANPAGFGRTDALTRIGNQVFAVDLDKFSNFQAANAAVRFPQIWDAPWLDWVQYNSSIADPLVRNIGESLGVRAMLTPGDLDNSVDMEGLAKLEDLLAGPGPYKGLTSPKWPAVFPALDAAKVSSGRTLYQMHCQGCHLPPVEELARDRESADPRYWSKSSAGMAFLRVTDINIQEIGTDPRAALDFRNRTADSGALKKGLLTAAEGLDLVTRAVATRYFEANQTPAEKRLAWAGYRTPGVETVRDKLVYKARPLNGIWAVAPYLHNGSVPNLYQLLSPRNERPVKFWTGSKQYDPERVGFEAGEAPGAFLYDTAVAGNSNAGHEFADRPRGDGVIGPALRPEERMALIEYLKSL